ncbi:MAG: alanine--tRNA ligase [Anaerolineales bacterium]
MSARKETGRPMSSAEIRHSFLDFFEARGHTIVPSASLVPGGDETLLFTNAGMVQFKDVFLGAGSRPYTRAVDVQRVMRVAGKHNDLDDVGRDDTHHTFFEMLGNWSFGDYYKKEAISWAWELLTEEWGLPKQPLYVTCFEDELGEIPKDEEAAEIWRSQPGFPSDHVLFFGRSENFWEMADTGPCGPDSEIFLDQGEEYCSKQDVAGHICQINGDCPRYVELWNLVFIQYNRRSPDQLDPLPARHVDTGMGFERIVSVLQGVDSNYATDLFTPLLARIQALAGHTDEERAALLTPYRVIADHARAATFLIGDGVVPGNTGRNYVCRMIIRRASRFGNYAGFHRPFLAKIAETVIEEYGDFYKEIQNNREAILETITQEEIRFHRTVEEGLEQLADLLEQVQTAGGDVLGGEAAFELYSTYGLPLEITRDVVREQGLSVDEDGFHQAMEVHREASSAEPDADVEDADAVEKFNALLRQLQDRGALPENGVEYDPYGGLERETKLVALWKDGQPVETASEGQRVAAVLPETAFYVESGGQVSDTGTIVSTAEPRWEIHVEDTRQPISGLVLHIGIVIAGSPEVGDQVLAAVDQQRRAEVMRNHTATHLLHAALHRVLGDHARQAGSLVAPDRLRFDFTHPEAMTPDQIREVEKWVNDAILANFPLAFRQQPREEAIEAGAMALFGETYGQRVRTVSVGDRERISFELCGGTHVSETGVIGPFLITSESSAAAGIRRIEAVTGREALDRIQSIRASQQRIADELSTSTAEVEARIQALLQQRDALTRELDTAQAQLAQSQFDKMEPDSVEGIALLTANLPGTPSKVLRELTDRYRNERGSGVVVLASTEGGQPILVAAVTQDLVDRGLHAGKLIQVVAQAVGGGGGGRPTLAQAGGTDAGAIDDALALVPDWVRQHLS